MNKNLLRRNRLSPRQSKKAKTTWKQESDTHYALLASKEATKISRLVKTKKLAAAHSLLVKSVKTHDKIFAGKVLIKLRRLISNQDFNMFTGYLAEKASFSLLDHVIVAVPVSKETKNAYYVRQLGSRRQSLKAKAEDSKGFKIPPKTLRRSLRALKRRSLRVKTLRSKR